MTNLKTILTITAIYLWGVFIGYAHSQYSDLTISTGSVKGMTGLYISDQFGPIDRPMYVSNLHGKDFENILVDDVNKNKIKGPHVGFYLICEDGTVYTDADCKEITNGWCNDQSHGGKFSKKVNGKFVKRH